MHQGPLTITNGWFALLSGAASCPILGTFSRRRTHIAVPIYAQLVAALLIMIAGRVAVMVLLHRPFLPRCSAGLLVGTRLFVQANCCAANALVLSCAFGRGSRLPLRAPGRARTRLL